MSTKSVHAMYKNLKLKQLIYLIILCGNFLLTNSNETEKNEDFRESSTKLLLTAKTYSKIFAVQRGQQNRLIKTMLHNSYEKNYKLLDTAYSKIFEVIHQNNKTLNEQGYSPLKDGFPKEQQLLQEAVTTTLENCCLSAEAILHFPEISYRIFKKVQYSKWKEMHNWCIEFAFAFQQIIDQLTIELMDLLAQEINIELRRADYVNPYYAKVENVENKEKTQKRTKKLKKGPQLSGGGRNEL